MTECHQCELYICFFVQVHVHARIQSLCPYTCTSLLEGKGASIFLFGLLEGQLFGRGTADQDELVLGLH